MHIYIIYDISNIYKKRVHVIFLKLLKIEDSI